jgi:hypothetical protein
MMVMTRLGLAKEENRPILAMNILTKNKGISTEDRLSLLIAMPVILDKINRTLSDESIQDLKDAIEESGESAKDFINEMMVEEIDGKEFVEAALAHKNRIEKLEDLRGRLVDQAKKTSRRPSDYMHKLLTNMLVTSDGVQMPKSRDIAAVPELMGLKATVVSINNTTHSYLCGGCANNHLADVRIAFEDFNMEFYIDNDFIIAVENED